ncbi:MAG: hypothetical protein ABI680_03690 [Chthoniobacteraceae bacterium]
MNISETIFAPVPESTARRPRRIHVLAFIFAALLAAPFVLFHWPAYSHTDICRECGTRRDVFALRSRFGDASWHDFTKISPTAVSQILAGTHGLPEHAHQWVSGAPGEPAVGETVAQTGLADTVEAPRVRAFLVALVTQAPTESVNRWRGIMLDPAFGGVSERALRFLRFPETGFPDEARFASWWQANEFALSNRLREMTEED